MFPETYIYYHNLCPEVRIHDTGITVLHSHNQYFNETEIRIAGGIESMICIYNLCASGLEEYQETHNLNEWEVRVLTWQVEVDRASLRSLYRMKEDFPGD